MSSTLANFNALKTALAKCVTIDEVKQIRDKAEAMRAYARTAGESLEMQNGIAEIKIRAERRAGELLREMDKHAGAATPLHDESALLPRLADLGISHTQSHRWQKIASVPEDAFEQHVASVKGRKAELTSVSVIKLAKNVTVTPAPSSTTPIDASSSIQDFIDAGNKFQTIYADPPWQYGNQATRAATNNHYPTMTLGDIRALPIGDIAADDSRLYLWTTNGFLFDSKSVVEAWGFEYKSCMVWVKPQMGIGNYCRVSHEFLLIASRGKTQTMDKGVNSWIQADRTKHSRKPEEFRKVVERLSPGPRIELFARESHDGWSAWGNEINNGLYMEAVA